MSSLLQTLIPPTLAALIAYPAILSRTSRLRSIIRADLDLLDSLPADHPSRATLTTHIEELVDTLVRREQRRFQPITPAGTRFGANVAITLIALLAVILMAVEVAGVYRPEPVDREALWWGLGFYALLGVCCASFAVRAWRRSI
jgi:Na+/H+ antiporter NhaD/arsenite permease-like protein